VDSVNNQVQLDEEGVLTPNKYDREYLSVYAGQFKPSKVPSKPVKQVIEDEAKCHLTEDEFLDKDFVPLQSIAELNDIIYDSERLQKMQQVEHKIILNDPSRKEELEMELVMVKAEYCKELNLNAKPEDFPIDLWSYVLDDQKELVASRFALFTNEVRTTLISDIMEKLDISKQFGEDLERYMRAQALANLDVFGYPNPYDPPTIPGYTFRIQTIHENPIYLPTQRFNQQETAFLEARLYELVNVAKVEQAPKSPHNLPLVLVPYTDRIKDSITKWTEKGLNPAEEMFKPSNYKEVAQWYRLTNNLKALNDITIPYRYPMPDQNDPKHFTKGSRYWSVTDIKDAFFCINLHPDDRDKTAFTTPRGRFRFTVMPQGATNSPPFFANVAQDTFSHIPKSELLNFIDDTTNHSRSFMQHLKTQQSMYDALRSKRLIMKISKSHFLQDSVRCLGYIFSEFGHTPDPIHIKAIMEMAPPVDQTGVRSYLGLLNFNQKYIPRYHELIAPLADLLKKETNGVPTDVKALWDDKIHGEAFRKAKIALTSSPCMMQIDVTKPFVLHVDSCKNGRGPGAVLLQRNEVDDLRPVAYFSCRLRKGEQAWSATELEAMGLVYSIRYWSPYLKVQKFTAIVDHHALIWLVTRPAKTANGRILHWISDLQEYHFDIIHKAGSKHLDADAISRLLHYSDIPERYPDSSDILAPIDGVVTHQDLVDAYKQMVEQRDYYLYLTSKTLLDVKGQKAELPEPLADPIQKVSKSMQTIELDKSVTEPGHTNSEMLLPVFSELLFPVLVNHGKRTSSSSSSSSSSSRSSSSSNNSNRMVSENQDEDYDSDNSYGFTEWERGVNRQIDQVQREIQEIEASQTEQVLTQLEERLQEQREQEQQPLPVELRPLLMRKHYVAPPKRTRGRPKKTIIVYPEPVGVPYYENGINIDINHPELARYKRLEHKIFQDPLTNRLYKVTLLAYDKDEGVVAYRRCLDDDPPDPKDDRPWKVEGSTGIARLVALYHICQDNPSNPISTAPLTPWPTNELEMLRLQKLDPNLQTVIEYLEENLEEDPDIYFRMTETKAFYMRRLEEGFGALRLMDAREPTPTSADRIVLPYSLRHQLLTYYHDEAGHPGRERTTLTIQKLYWWTGLRTDVENYVNSCQYCQFHKPNNHTAKLPIQEYPAPTFPFEVCNMDLTGEGFPTTKRGNTIIIVIKCALTRYVEIEALPNKEEITVARILVEKIYCRHGAPSILISDNGTEFVNELTKQICILLNIGRITTTPYNPRSNGLVEQHNATLKTMLAAYVNRYQDDWDLYLPHVAYAYNTTISTSTGATPFCMMYGREARQLCNEWIDKYMDKLDQNQFNSPSTPDYILKLANALQLGWDLAGLKKTPTVAKWNRVARARLPFKEYEIGSRFFLRHIPTYLAQTTATVELSAVDSEPHIINKKLQAKWTGPYTITKKFSPVLYEAIINQVPRVVHALNMKPDPIADALRSSEPLEPSPLTPLPNMLDQQHISAQLEEHRPLSAAINTPRVYQTNARK
jgi:transposase InsO family protein